MNYDRPVRKKLLGDTAIAARWMPFAMQKVRQLVGLDLPAFSKNYEVDDASIRIWDDVANIYVTIEGKGTGGYFVEAFVVSSGAPAWIMWDGVATKFTRALASFSDSSTSPQWYAPFSKGAFAWRLETNIVGSNWVLEKYIRKSATSVTTTSTGIFLPYAAGSTLPILNYFKAGKIAYSDGTSLKIVDTTTFAQTSATDPGIARDKLRLVAMGDSNYVAYATDGSASPIKASIDDGATWTVLSYPTADFRSPVILYNGPTSLIMAGVHVVGLTVTYKVYTSTDTGQTWVEMGSLTPLGTSKVITEGANIVGDRAIFVSNETLITVDESSGTWEQMLISTLGNGYDPLLSRSKVTIRNVRGKFLLSKRNEDTGATDFHILGFGGFQLVSSLGLVALPSDTETGIDNLADNPVVLGTRR